MDCHPQSASHDYEGQFYTTLSSALDSGERLATADDFVKVSDGPQAVQFTDGSVALVLVYPAEMAQTIVSACEHYDDHECDEAKLLAKVVLYSAGHMIRALHDETPAGA